MSDSFEILYAAHTATCTFLLDSEGICRRIALLPNPKRNLTSKGRDATRAASRCVGAQYVASLDPTVSGMLAEMPRVGAAMLFARVDERGRVSLVRTGVVTRFEGHREDPFVGGVAKRSVEANPSGSVETSAPVLTPKIPAPRRREPNDPYRDERDHSTAPVQTVRAEDYARTERRAATAKSPVQPRPFRQVADDSLNATWEYESKGTAPPPPARDAITDLRRVTWPSAGADPSLTPGAATLRQPPVLPGSSDDEHDLEKDPYVTAQRPPPRRSEPFMTRTRSDRAPRPVEATRPPNYPVIDKVAVRRRGER